MLYSLTGVLMALLGFVLLRYVVFCAVWVLTGYHLWFCPRIMDEKVGRATRPARWRASSHALFCLRVFVFGEPDVVPIARAARGPR